MKNIDTTMQNNTTVGSTNVFFNKYLLMSHSISQTNDVDEIINKISLKTGLNTSDFFLLQNGKQIQSKVLPQIDVCVILRVIGGKGGFGSMLRAIGAQIEKTTNREACRDLSGRRLRDINEEKRLKEYLEKIKDRNDDECDLLRKKIQKLLAKAKHEFKDEQYEKARSSLTENISASVEEGFKNAKELTAAAGSSNSNNLSNNGIKRKSDDNFNKNGKKKKKTNNLWIGDDLSSSSKDEDSSDDSEDDSTNKNYNKEQLVNYNIASK